MATKTGNIKDRSVLVKFTERTWRGGLVDHAVTNEVQKQNKAKTNVGHFWKRLIPKTALRAVFNAGSAARNFHLEQTLPWMEGGVRILPVANFKDYMDGMRKLLAKAQQEHKKFLKEYPEWIKEAKRSHGKLYNRDQFPSHDEISSRFYIGIDVMPLPSVADWRVELDAAQMKQLRTDAEKNIKKVMGEGVQELCVRLKDMLQHANEKLDDPEATFRDSLVGNIREMLELMSKLNVAGDKNLEDLRKETEKQFGKVTAETLRLDPKARKDAAKAAREIMKKMGSFMAPEAPAAPLKKIQPRAKA